MESELNTPISLRILTPAGVVVEEIVTSLKIPMADGEIGVLPNHISYVGLLGTGVCEYKTVGSESESRLVISGGFCNLVDDSISILTDEALTVDAIDRESYAKEREEMKSLLLAGYSEDPERVYAQRRLELISAVDALVGH